MNGVVLLVGGLLLLAVIKLLVDQNWLGLLLCAVALMLVLELGIIRGSARKITPGWRRSQRIGPPRLWDALRL